MKRMLVFASRNTRELLRDRINLAFGIGFPLVLMLLVTAIQANIPVELFALNKLTPGVAVFGFSFLSLFSGMLIAKDRTTSFLMRLFASPLTATDFILGYTLPLLPLAIAQSLFCFLVAFVLGLAPTIHVVVALLVLLPSAVLFIAIGLLCGSVLTDRQVGGICGALLTNLTGWLSGTWFDLSLVGHTFQTVSYLLPFARAVDATRAALNGNYAAIFPDLWWVIVYALALLAVAIFFFNRKMRSDNP
jgi:ABC-2 type transport system permease protein